MNYQKHYDLLINRAKNRIINEYTERHHIIPECMGGPDDESNKVRLTAPEHYVAHQLLVKIFPNEPKLIFAAHRMSSGTKKQTGRSKNKLYEWIRIKHARAISKKNKGNTYSIGWIPSEETRKLWSEQRRGKESPMKGRKNPAVTLAKKGKISPLKGRSYEQIYGREKSSQLKKIKSESQLKTIKKTDRSVLLIELDMIFRTCAEAARYVNISHRGDIGKAASGKTRTCGGYHWKFV